jgi:hypothetical protein
MIDIKTDEDFRLALLDILLRYSCELNTLRNSMDGTDIGAEIIWRCLSKVENETMKSITPVLSNANSRAQR